MTQLIDKDSLLLDLRNAMLELYNRTKKEIGYTSPRFFMMITDYGPLVTAQKLIHKSGGTNGFKVLWERHRLDLSVEALVLKPQYRSLFTTDELRICRERLAAYDYVVDEPDVEASKSNACKDDGIVLEVKNCLNKNRLLGAFDRFVEYIHDQDCNELPLDFAVRDGILKREEGYKSIDVIKAREILGVETWNESMIGTGEIGSKVKKAVNKCYNLVDNHSIIKLGNMVDITNKQYSIDAEKAIYKIYREDNEKESFEYAKSVFGGTYDLIACLFFIKDEGKFLPIRSANFDKRFEQLDINYKTSANCSWDNYIKYISIIDCIREEMNSYVSLEHPARLLDAHSFVWIIGEDKYIGWIPNKEKCSEEVDSIEEELEEKKLSDGEERTALIKVRINQGAYRKELLKRYCSCAICGMGFDKALIASHIKPWRDCTKEEKTDIDNGFILCPNHDKLFDTGFISFDDNGSIIISQNLSESDCNLLGINADIKISLTEGNKKYLRFHRKLFKKNLS